MTYPNPLVRPVWCDNTNATCYVPASTTNTSGSNIQFSGIDQNPYWDGANHNLLVARLVFAPPHTLENSVGAVYFNLTTAYIDVFIQEQQDRAIFEMQLEYDANLTAYYTMTVRYGQSIQGLISNYPCYERMITYAIILTDFMAEPGQVQRIAGCNRADNCCYFLPINVFGNTLETESIVNLARSQPDDAARVRVRDRHHAAARESDRDELRRPVPGSVVHVHGPVARGRRHEPQAGDARQLLPVSVARARVRTC